MCFQVATATDELLHLLFKILLSNLVIAAPGTRRISTITSVTLFDIMIGAVGALNAGLVVIMEFMGEFLPFSFVESYASMPPLQTGSISLSLHANLI